jgi:low affinity Fe/Cu permease
MALLACVVWAATGPFVGYSDTWQLTINTATTVITFLAVFVIQNTQNRDTLATQLKLDELLRAVEAARTGLVNLESCTDEELAKLREEFERLGRRAGGPGGSRAAR